VPRDTKLSRDAGLFMTNGNGRMLGAAIVVILATIAWTLGHMVPFFYVMQRLGLLRVSEKEEVMGLDKSHHGGSAYDMNAAGTLADEEVGGKGASTTSNIIQRSVAVLPDLPCVLSVFCMLPMVQGMSVNVRLCEKNPLIAFSPVSAHLCDIKRLRVVDVLQDHEP
jgi:hypothetical protein